MKTKNNYETSDSPKLAVSSWTVSLKSYQQRKGPKRPHTYSASIVLHFVDVFRQMLVFVNKK